MEHEQLIKVDGLTLSYENMTVIENLSFDVKSGDYLCIVGENGSGKSTLVKALLSLKKPVGGEITFCGADRNEIGYLPQQTSAQQDFPASVGEVVISGCQNRMGLRPFYTEKERKIADENMERLGILDLKKRCYRELSGGQQQRVLLARALCATKKLLLLDEPVSGLDPMVTAEMYSLIKKLNSGSRIPQEPQPTAAPENGAAQTPAPAVKQSDDRVTIIMVTHDISAAVREANKILCLRQDSWFFGTTEEFLCDSSSDFLKGGAANG